MRDPSNIFKAGALAAVMALTYPLTAGANQHENEGTAQSQRDSGSAEMAASDQSNADKANKGVMEEQRWREIREQTVSARELMGADVQNIGNPVGNVRDLVLNEDGTAVQYVLYEVPYPYAFAGGEDGYATFDNVAVETATAGFGIDLRFDDEAAAQAPETLKIDRAEADHRLVSRLLGDTVSFSGASDSGNSSGSGKMARQIEDLLIDRETGEISGYVVNRNPDSWFNNEPAVIRPDQVEVSQQGEVTTTAEFAALESIE